MEEENQQEEHQQAGNHHVCSAGSLRHLCRTGLALWLHQKIKCWSAQTVWRSYVVCSSFGNRWVTANLFFLPYPSVAFLLFGTKSYFLMMYGKGTRSSSGSCDFERWRHEIAVTTANFRLHFAQFSVWLTGTLSSLCALVSVCIASQHLSNRSWFHYHPQLSIWETQARLSARLTVCVRTRRASAHLLNVIGREPPESSKDHCEFATSVTLMYRHTRSQRSRNLLDWNVVS